MATTLATDEVVEIDPSQMRRRSHSGSKREKVNKDKSGGFLDRINSEQFEQWLKVVSNERQLVNWLFAEELVDVYVECHAASAGVSVYLH